MKMDYKDRKPNLRYRPPQSCLDLFWVLCEDDDEKRVNAAIQLAKMIKSVEEESEREQMRTYCVSRLVKGLGSQRLLARIGFSIGLAALLRALSEVKTGQVLEIFQRRLTTGGKIASKSERIRAHVGRISAMSAIIQAGRLENIKADSLEFIVEELLIMPEIRISLLPVCCKVLEDIVGEVSEEMFVNHVWPKLAPNLGMGWENCTLDRISLLLVCKETYPKIVDKIFLKKYWGPSLFCEENDQKLLWAIRNQDFTSKSSIMREKILPYILNSGRDALSIWQGIGEKMMFSMKDKFTLPRKEKYMSQKQLFALDLLSKLIDLTSDMKKILSLICDPNVVKVLFMETEKQKDGKIPLQATMVCNLCEKLKKGGGNILSFVTKVLELEKQTEDDLAEEGKLSYIHHNNFRKIVDLMDKTQMEQYVNTLIKYVKGKDKDLFYSNIEEKRIKQVEWCFRQLQHICCSQNHTTPDMQRSVLALFIRIGYFNGVSKTGKIVHCNFVESFVEAGKVRKMCESFLFKCLDHLSTMNPDQSSKKDNLSRYTELLSYLIDYLQSLLTCQSVKLVSTWSEETQDIWTDLLERIKSFEEDDSESNPAFKLLYLYMGLSLLDDVKAATDVLKDIFICHDKSIGKERTEDESDEEEEEEDEDGDKTDPHWVEVLTEILLQLLSNQSHLARVISSTVFKMILPHINSGAVSLILQILNPDKKQEEDMFDEHDEDDDDGDDGGDDEEVEEDEDGEESGNDEKDVKAVDGENSMEVDEEFRASIKEALGHAAVEDKDDEDDDDNDDEDEEDLPDMSDSEMSKLDEALAEVFRQRKKKSKKGREEKRREVVYFKMRVLDLLDILIKSERLGEFLLDLPQPLLLLMSKSNREEDKAACNRAKASFQLLKAKSKGVKCSGISEEEISAKFEELIALANKVKDTPQLQHIATACALVIKLSKGNCLQVLQETLKNVIDKKQTKPLPSFFIALLDTNPIVFFPLCTTLLDCLKSNTANKESQAMACTLLTSLVKKGKQTVNEPVSQDNSWLEKTAVIVCKLIQKLDKDTVRGLYVKELLALTLALLNRTDILSVTHFDAKIMQLKEIRSKMGMDNKRMTNKIFAAFERLSKKGGNTNGKKRKAEMKSPNPKKKGKKMNVEDVKDE